MSTPPPLLFNPLLLFGTQEYINKRGCIYHILPGQWLRKTFPGMIFANSNVPEKSFRVCLNEDETFELPEDSKQIFKRNVVDR